MKKTYLKTSFLIYTGSFLLLLPIIFSAFLTEGKTLVWKLDGLDQHYPALIYYGKLLRGLLMGRGFPMVDFKIGMGFDTLTTLHYYVIGDPISLLSVFMTSRNGIYFYNFLILLRLYLAGISFILLMRYMKKEGSGAVLGALIYVFSGFALYAGSRHPFFINPMIWLPLIIIGVEQVLRGKKPYLMICIIFISTMSNFYFFYDITIITVIFVIFRYFAVYRKNYHHTFTGLILTGIKTGGYYLLGTALASVIFIPVLYAFSQNGRLNVRPMMVNGYLHYDVLYYLTFFQGLISGGTYPGYWTVLSFSPIVIVSLAVLMVNKKYRQLQIIYLLAFTGLFIPAFGYFMNGLSYDANRWCFLVSLLTGITFTLTYDKLFSLEKKEKAILFLETAIYSVLAFVFPSKVHVKIIFFILLFIIVLILILQSKWLQARKNLSRILLFALVFLSLGFNGYALYSKQFGNYTDQFLSRGEVNKKSHKGVLSLIKDINDKSFYRIETYGDEALNEALNVRFRDVSGYYSLMDTNVTSYLKELEVLSQRTAFRFENLDTRTILDELAGVKYFVTTDSTAVPYGYQLLKEVVSGSDKFYLYQNAYALPLGYTYENYILKQDYDKLSALEKQNALLNSVVLDQKTDYAGETNQNNSIGIQKMAVKITPDANVTLSNNLIDVKQAGATITLEFNSKPDSETYIRLGKLNINLKQNIMFNFDAKGDQGSDKEINVRSAYYNSYFGKENYLINTGYSASGETKAVLTFPEKMSFRYDSIEVYSVDMSNYSNQVTALNKASLKNITKSNNRIYGDITLDRKGVMVLSIPYSKGWSAYVDGGKEKLLRANVMYMALPLDTGSHHITLKYETPYLRTGCFVSLTAFLIFISMMIWFRRHNSLTPEPVIYCFSHRKKRF